MNYQIGDPVVHCSYGVGKVTGVEERAYNNTKVLFYKIEVNDLTIWVPADENINKRLRPPVSAAAFKKLLATLSSPAEHLPKDRRERNTMLQERMKDGSVESLCKVLRDLKFFRRDKTWSDYDSALMKRAQKALLGEWVHSLSVTPEQAEADLQNLLG